MSFIAITIWKSETR